ncbi:MAG: DUF6036 family nucleotidyltransferase [Pirellulaceae bacterium]
MAKLETKFDALLRVLSDHQVDYIVIGGVAAVVYGANRATFDIDIVYSRQSENIKRLANALAPLQPYLRNTPPGLPFKWDERTLLAGLNFTLETTLGYIDVLGEVTGGGSYVELLPYSAEINVYGVITRCVTLERLIFLKRAAGRPKDFEALAELELLFAERLASQPHKE